MRNLFLINGVDGGGKTELLEYVARRYPGLFVGVMRKHVTRKARAMEHPSSRSVDIHRTTSKEFFALTEEPGAYWYEFGGGLYGFRKTDLDALLAEHTNVFVIVRNRITIKELIADYSHLRVITVFVYADESTIRERLTKLGYPEAEVNKRLCRTRFLWTDYDSEPLLYQEVLFNNSEQGVFHAVIERLLHKYNPPLTTHAG